MFAIMLAGPTPTHATISTTSYSYDIPANSTTKINPDLTKIKQTYDNVNRLDTLQLIGADNIAIETFNFTYDLTDQITNITGSNGETTFGYDDFDRLASIRDFGSAGDLLTFAYDHKDRLTWITYPGNGRVCYQYDPDGRLTRVGRVYQNNTALICSGADEITDYSFDNRGRLIKVLLPNGIERFLDYDNTEGQLSAFGYKNANGRLIYRDAFKYVPGSSLYFSITRTTPTEQNTTYYEYDAYERVTKVTEADGRQTTYGYDAFGNRVSENVTNIKDPSATNDSNKKDYGLYTYEYPAKSNRLNRVLLNDQVLESFAYDNNGRMASRTLVGDGASITTTYGYDVRGYLINVNKPSLTVSYTYDAFGNRKSKTTNGETINYLAAPIFGMQRTLLELAPDMTIKSTYVHAGNSILKEEPSATNRETDLYYLNDGIVGSVTHAVDMSGKVQSAFDFGTFGVRTQTQTSAQNSNSSFGYTGEMFDDATGLLYLRARYYDPGLGRFISPDPFLGRLEQPVTQNRYIYVHNNPLLFTDPSGLESDAWVAEWTGFGYDEVDFENEWVPGLPNPQMSPDIQLKFLRDPSFWNDASTKFGRAAFASALFGPEVWPATAIFAGLSGGAKGFEYYLQPNFEQFSQEQAIKITSSFIPGRSAYGDFAEAGVSYYFIDYTKTSEVLGYCPR